MLKNTTITQNIPGSETMAICKPGKDLANFVFMLHGLAMKYENNMVSFLLCKQWTLVCADCRLEVRLYMMQAISRNQQAVNVTVPSTTCQMNYSKQPAHFPCYFHILHDE